MKTDPTKPYNDLPKLPPAIDLKEQSLLLKTIEVGEKISQLETLLVHKKNSLANAMDLLSPLFVPEAVSSSGVENIITTNESVYIAKISDERDLSPAEKEALNYVSAISRGFVRVIRKEFLATNDYIEIQRVLEPSKSGIRKIPGTALRNPVTGRVYYTPPEGELLIRDLLKNFEDYFNEKAPSHEVFSRMAILHYQFEAIHPFPDANGRTGRMLMSLYLTKQGYLSFPILFISRFILENRDKYYEALRNVTYKNDWDGWIHYILDATIAQADYTCKILVKVNSVMDEVRDEIKRSFPRILSTEELVNFLFTSVYFTQKQFEKALQISPMTARKYLQYLQDKDIVYGRKQTGKNRFIYITPKYINILKKV